MKISKLFHWLYAILMILPFVSVLTFTLYYAFNKNADIPMVTESISKEVDFNQLIKNGKPLDLSYYSVLDNNTISYTDNGIDILGDSNTNYIVLDYNQGGIISNNEHVKLIKFDFVSTELNYYTCSDTSLNYFGISSKEFITTSVIPDLRFTFVFFDGTISTNYVNFFHLQIFDLTQMFGSGNEPTIQDFDTWFSNDYYDYTLSSHLVIDNYDTRQVLDSPINHIWLPSFGAMGWTIKNVFTFLISTMFGISVASGIGYTILYLLTYWLCISLIWLVYDVIMYVPLMIHRWLDKGVID